MQNTLNHPFYIKSKKEQVKFQMKVAAVALTSIAIFVVLSILIGFYILPIFIISIALSVLAPFFDNPSLAKSGKLIYYSPLFVAEKEHNGIITIHGGTLFDYYFVIGRKVKGSKRKKIILFYYIEGLLNLIDKYHRLGNTDIKVKGTSYILNQRTAEKLGLQKVKTSFTQQIILIFNYIRLTVEYSFSKGKLQFPSISKVGTYEGTISDLIARKEYLVSLKKKMDKEY